VVLGGLLVVVLLAGWRVPGGTVARGADVHVTVNRSGELAVEPAGRLMVVRDLVSGRVVRALVVVTNTTGTALGVRVRARVDSADLDDRLMVRVSTWWGRPLFEGPLRQLRGFTRQRLVLASGASVPLVVRVWLSPRARGYRGRSAEVSLELRSAAAD
jgi:hypothetical protein